VQSCRGLKSQDIKNFEKFLCFLGKTTPYIKIFIILFQRFSSPYRSTCSNFVKSGRREIGEIVCCLSDKKKFAWLSSCRYKICQGQPQQCTQEGSRVDLNWFTFGGVIAECVNTSKTCCKVNSSLALSRIITYLGVLYVNMIDINIHTITELLTAASSVSWPLYKSTVLAGTLSK